MKTTWHVALLNAGRSSLTTASLLAAILALASCKAPFSAKGDSSSGSLSLSASMPGLSTKAIARSPAPSFTAFPAGVDLSSVSYALTLTSPSSSASPISGGTSSTGNFATLDNIPEGDWTASVAAIASGVTVGTGSTAIKIVAGQTTSATIDVGPPSTGTGTVSLAASWPYLAVPTVIITPIDPSGSAITLSPFPTVLTSYSVSQVLPCGEYRVELLIATTDGTLSSVQTRVSDIAYVFAGRTTGLSYASDFSSWKGGAPATPVLTIETGYNLTSGPCAYVSWSGATGAASYDVERSDAGGPYNSIVSGVTGGGYIDVGLLNTYHYVYRITAHDSSMSYAVSTTAAAPMATLTLATTVGGTLGGAGAFLLNTPAPISITSPTSFTAWTLSSGSATITSATSPATTVFLSSDATITAN